MDAANLGNVLTVMQIIAILGGGMFFLYRMEGKIQLITTVQSAFIERLDKVDIKLEQLTGVVIQIARQEQRLDASDKRLQEISTRIDGMNIYELDKVVRRRRKI